MGKFGGITFVRCSDKASALIQQVKTEAKQDDFIQILQMMVT
jgi:hypothetical protein